MSCDMRAYLTLDKKGKKRPQFRGLFFSRPLSNLRRNDGGFSVIEVLIAVILVVVGLVAFGNLGGSIVDQNTYQKRSDQALTLAQQKLEDLKNLALSSTLTSSNNGSDTPSIANNAFSRSWTIANGGAGSLATLAVTVTWSDKGATKTERLRTYLSQ